MKNTEMYWQAAKSWVEIQENNGRDGRGRPPIKKLKKEFPGGVLVVWKRGDGTDYDDASKIIRL